MSQGSFSRGRFEDPSKIKTISVPFRDQDFTITQGSHTFRKPILKLPADGRIVSAQLIPKATVAAGTVNYAVGLANGAQADPPAGTITIASAVGGASGLTADRPVALT